MFTIRSAIRSDSAAIKEITARITEFSAEERDCVSELWEDYLKNEGESDYHFCIGFSDQATVGYACYGKHALTQNTYDLYWIAVDPGIQGKGAGSALLNFVEDQISSQQIYSQLIIETSSLPAYQKTRKFYKKHNYRVKAILRNFYSKGDHLVIFIKVLRAKAVATTSPDQTEVELTARWGQKRYFQ